MAEKLVLLPRGEIDIILPHGIDSHVLRVSVSDFMSELFDRHNRLIKILNDKPFLRDKIRLEILKNDRLYKHLALYKHFMITNRCDTADETEESLDDARKNLEIIRKILPLLHPLPLISARIDRSDHLRLCEACKSHYEEDVKEYEDVYESLERDNFEQLYSEFVAPKKPQQSNAE